MKKLLIIIWVLCGIQSYAQEKIDRKDLKGPPVDYLGYHITDTRLDKFIGTWEWKEGKKSFRLSLNKLEAVDMKGKLKYDLVFDIIQGKYAYSEDNNDKNLNWSKELFIELGTSDDEYTLGFLILDRKDGHMYTGNFMIDDDNPDRASLKFYQQEKHNFDWPGKPPVEKEEGVEIPGGVKSLEDKVLTRVTN